MPHKPGPKTELRGEKMHRVTFTLDDLTRRMLRVLGSGNESRGVREAARAAYRVRNTPILDTTTDSPGVPTPGPVQPPSR